MRFPTVGLVLLLLSGFAFAAGGRSPAVEDFVGIEIEQPDTSPQGKDSLFNLEKDINQLQQVEAATYISHPKTPKEHTMDSSSQFIQWNMTNILASILLFCLPLLSWYMAVNHLRKKATVESASNIEVLEKYRRERELARKKDEEYKKVA